MPMLTSRLFLKIIPFASSILKFGVGLHAKSDNGGRFAITAPKSKPWQGTLVGFVLALQLLSVAISERRAVANDLSKDSSAVSAVSGRDRYGEIVRADSPVAYWRFSDSLSDPVKNVAADGESSLSLIPHLHSLKSIAGPVPTSFPLFSSSNLAVSLREPQSYFTLADPGDKSPLDFDNGDEITLEAWVNPVSQSGMPYLIGKGRLRPGMENQNYGLRLQEKNGGMAVGFLFRSRGEKPDWHRWVSDGVMAIGDGWHHVALTYRFGDSKSLAAYIDGVPTKGRWDMGGETSNPPVVDNDAVWIGSGQNAIASASYLGGLDEVAIYRKALTAKQVRSHYQYVRPEFITRQEPVPETGVLVQIYEDLSDKKSWEFRPPKYSESFQAPHFGFLDVPKKYNEKGIHVDRSNPYLMVIQGKVVIPEGEHRLLIRSRNSARLSMDGKLLAETKFHSLGGDSGPVFEVDRSLAPQIRPLHRGDHEAVVTVNGDGNSHTLTVEAFVGGNRRRQEVGEFGVYLATPTGDFKLLGSEKDYWLTDAAWLDYVQDQEQYLRAANMKRRQIAGANEVYYWTRRHEWARQIIDEQEKPAVPEVGQEYRGNNWIDRFIGAKLEAAGTKPGRVIDDHSFLRRLTLDTTGRMPTILEIDQFLSDPPESRRKLAIERMLNEPEWADHWVSYWQDVLAENPNIINPTLNNTGPFRFWIEESFRDNKPFDRFVTELVMMEGSLYYGGPAGFAMASQNDAPMAAKAHVLGEAFLGVQMNCARCHDAPFHDVKQRDLFSMAAMLSRKQLVLPKTSTVPGGSNSHIISITLEPGDTIVPDWAFDELSADVGLDQMMRDPNDARERVALLLTSPKSQRFASVFVNRLWARYLGYGFVEKPEDWEGESPSHPELLTALSQEFASNNYDIKHLARLIFESETYQRESTTPTGIDPEVGYDFAKTILRRLTAEQLVDSMFACAGKEFDADYMCIDIDTGRNANLSLNLGRLTKSWQFASLSNERDRPSLDLPYAAPFVNTLENFGWRSSRQDPRSTRPDNLTPLQPAEIENGILSRRITTLSDDGALTQAAIEAESPEEFINVVYRRFLTRLPTASELELFNSLLREGFSSRIVENAEPVKREKMVRSLVAWTNHLNPDASKAKLKMKEEVQAGDPPTNRLVPEWRARAEDLIWSVLNSPEFMFVP